MTIHKPFTLCFFILVAAAAPGLRASDIVYLIGEKEYKTAKTLPDFHRKNLGDHHRAVFVTPDKPGGNRFATLVESLKKADLLVVSVRRRALPKDQLAAIRAYVASGKPVVGIRTASHAFDTKGKIPSGHDNWVSFDRDVFGGNYNNHYGKGLVMRVAADNPQHPLLEGVKIPWETRTHLYRVSPLAESATPLLFGAVKGKKPEPVAWTNARRGGGRAFYVGLGGPEDFANESFRRLLINGITWALASGDADNGGPLQFTVKDIAGNPVKLSKYRGKVVLVVNVASRCGATPQYRGLQELHDKYAEKGLAVLGFPCNQFGRQEPGSEKQIRAFCTKEYGVTFDLFSKIDVNGKTASPLYQYLTGDRVALKDTGPVKWNFEKFLINRSGRVIGRFRTGVRPAQIEKTILAALEKSKEKP